MRDELLCLFWVSSALGCCITSGLRLEEVEVVGLKKLEFPGRKYGVPEKLRVPVFHLMEVAARLVPNSGRGSDAKVRRSIQVMIGKGVGNGDVGGRTSRFCAFRCFGCLHN